MVLHMHWLWNNPGHLCAPVLRVLRVPVPLEQARHLD
jgi:hypothetical protein